MFDVACTLIDVMTCVPLEHTGFELGPRDYLSHFLHLIGKLRGGKTRYLPLLVSKVNEALPGLVEGSIPLGLPPPTPMVEREFQELEDDAITTDEGMLANGDVIDHSYETPLALSMKQEYPDIVATSTYGHALTPYDHRSSHSRSYSPPDHAQVV